MMDNILYIYLIPALICLIPVILDKDIKARSDRRLLIVISLIPIFNILFASMVLAYLLVTWLAETD